MNVFVSRLVLSSLILAIAGCGGSLIESKKIDYKSTRKADPLEIPPDLTAPSRDDRFAVPDTLGKGAATYSAYSAERTPQARAARQSDILPQVDNSRIERSGNQRWLVVPGSPEKIWGTVKDFWQETGFLIKLELPEAGVMETDWAENRAKIPQGTLRDILGKALDTFYSTAERDKFRTRLEPGLQAGTTDVFISHRGMYEVFVSEGKDQTRWQPRAADPDLEAEMLRRLMVRFGADEKRAAAALVAAQEQQQEKARLSRSADGTGTLELGEPFDRAWRRVGLVLDRVGFTVEDRDRSKGMYFVRYVDPELDGQKKDEGFMSKLAFWKSASGPAAKTQYRILVKNENGVSKVQVLSPEGGADQSETSKKILALLHDQLK